MRTAPARATPEEDAAGVAPAARSLPSRARARPLWAHATVLLLALLALLPLMSPAGSFSSDEGAYALQVEALEDGSWAYDYKASPYDPEGRYFPVYLSTRSASGWYPYVKHPAYPLLLQAARRVAGPTLGLHLLALLGTVGTAAAAWLLAAELAPQLSRPAFWLAAAGPALANGFLIWAHAPSAALAGLGLVGAARIVRRGFTPVATAGVVAALVGGVLLRSEGLLLAVAVACGLAWVLFRQDRRRESLAALGLTLPPVVAAVLEHAWVEAIVGRGLEPLGVRQGELPYLEGRLSGAVHELFHSPGQHPRAALPMVLALVLVTGLGSVALRRWGPGSRRDLAVLTVGAVGLLATRLVLRPYDPVTGLFAAWPLALLGIVLLARNHCRGPTIALLGATVVLFVGAVFLTQYPEGGATEWGGRFLSPVLAPLAVLAAAGLAAAIRAVPGPQRTAATALLATVAAAFALFGLATVGLQRARVERVAHAVARHPSPVTVTTGAFLPRAGWTVHDQVSWMQAERDELPALLGALRAQDVRQVTVLLPAWIPPPELTGFPAVEEATEPDLADVGLRLLVGKA